MRKVFLGVPLGEDGHVEDSPIGKLDLQDFLHLLGAHKIRRWDIRDGWPTAQLPFLTLRILQSFGSLEGGVHPGVLPECGISEEPIRYLVIIISSVDQINSYNIQYIF